MGAWGLFFCVVCGVWFDGGVVGHRCVAGHGVNSNWVIRKVLIKFGKLLQN